MSVLYPYLLQSRRQHKKHLAVLIDPDKAELPFLDHLLKESLAASVDFFFLGGSLVMQHQSEHIARYLKSRCTIPVVLFPGSVLQVHDAADALLLLSLVSGRNPDLLIGQQVTAAPLLKQMQLEILSTAYLLIDGGRPTTASYISHTQPIPHDKPSVAACTAMAAEMLGMKLAYLDTGSGAQRSVSAEMIAAVRHAVDVPLIVGGGIRTAAMAQNLCRAGADVLVVGTAFEEQPQLIGELAAAVHSFNQQGSEVWI